ncbi:hypothetical protein FDP41_007140 [Naegleria fowleri]|uniref:F-box domain-containing protein n=1 Tax=Naegleria fowleri TaxID=5763 RepID=A0A6A5B4Q6_NAEFO|nr:uncharacterized protein FDP41_007140 [Naegleria fowleri]KAF0973753.1 hypothetical protein FDP41_007140 [Naegleria fowleri]
MHEEEVNDSTHNQCQQKELFLTANTEDHPQEESLLEKKHVLASEEEYDEDRKKRKIKHVNGQEGFFMDILKHIFLYLDVPDFGYSRPWFVCKYWNQVFCKKGHKFPKLYLHSYFSLNEEQKTSLNEMLKEFGMSHKNTFEKLLKCMNWNFVEELDTLFREYKQNPSERLLSQMEKLVQFQKRISSKQDFERVIRKNLPPSVQIMDEHAKLTSFSILKENLFKIIVVTNQKEEQTEREDYNTLSKKKISCITFLTNGFPLKFTISYRSTCTETGYGKHSSINDYEITEIRFEGDVVLKVSSEVVSNPYGDDHVEFEHSLEFECWKNFLVLETTPPLSTDQQYASILIYWLKQFLDIPFPTEVDTGLSEVRFCEKSQSIV